MACHASWRASCRGPRCNRSGALAQIPVSVTIAHIGLQRQVGITCMCRSCRQHPATCTMVIRCTITNAGTFSGPLLRCSLQRSPRILRAGSAANKSAAIATPCFCAITLRPAARPATANASRRLSAAHLSAAHLSAAHPWTTASVPRYVWRALICTLLCALLVYLSSYLRSYISYTVLFCRSADPDSRTGLPLCGSPRRQCWSHTPGG